MGFYAFTILLGIYLCGIGASAGSKFMTLRVWMAVSCAIGLFSFVLWCNSTPNQFLSNLWILINVGILLPFLSILCLDSCKPCIYALTAVCGWMFFAHVLNNGLSAYAPMIRVAVSLSLTVSCALAALSGQHRVLLVTLATAAMADAMLYSFSLEWFKFNPPHAWWAVRNLIWCGVYISMAYTVRRR